MEYPSTRKLSMPLPSVSLSLPLRFFPRPRGGVRSAIYIEYVHKCHVLVAARSLRDIDRCLGPPRRAMYTRSYATFLVARRIASCVCVLRTLAPLCLRTCTPTPN